MGTAANLDASFTADRLQSDPDAPVRQEKGYHTADDQHGTAEPDDPDTGVFGNLQTGKVSLFEVEQGKNIIAAAQGIEIRSPFRHLGKFALPGGSE